MSELTQAPAVNAKGYPRIWLACLMVFIATSLGLPSFDVNASICIDLPSTGEDSDAADLLDRQNREGCFEKVADWCRADVCSQISTTIEEDLTIDQVAKFGETMGFLVRAARELEETYKPAKRLHEALKQLEDSIVKGGEVPSRAEWSNAGLVVFRGTDRALDLAASVDDACLTTPENCKQEFMNAQSVLGYSTIAHRIISKLLEDDIEITRRYVERLNNQWSVYGDMARALYPWEWVINGNIHRRRGTREGFVEPPSSQWLVFHPSIALEYDDDALDGFEESIQLEILGYQRWEWVIDDTVSRMRKRLGGSVFLSWTGANHDEPGYGAMIYLPKNLSLGVVRRKIDDRYTNSVLLSVDVAKIFTNAAGFRKKLSDLR